MPGLYYTRCKKIVVIRKLWKADGHYAFITYNFSKICKKIV